MKKTLTLATMALLAAGCTSTQLQSVKDAASEVARSSGGAAAPLTNSDVIAGLKEALSKGAEQSVSFASALNGFNENARIRIPFPPEAEKVKNTLNTLGMNKQVEEFELTLNRAAETAAKEAVPVFLDAIKGMSVADGFAILKGEQNAATQYLQRNTTATLTAKFRPIVENATKSVALTNYWTPLTSAYNKAILLTGGQAVNPDLDGYVTEKAIEGLFVLIADKEAEIRQDPLARTSDLLKRVFGNN